MFVAVQNTFYNDAHKTNDQLSRDFIHIRMESSHSLSLNNNQEQDNTSNSHITGLKKRYYCLALPCATLQNLSNEIALL